MNANNGKRLLARGSSHRVIVEKFPYLVTRQFQDTRAFVIGTLASCCSREELAGSGNARAEEGRRGRGLSSRARFNIFKSPWRASETRARTNH